MPVYPPIAVANTFVRDFGGNGGLEHMKLQKLVYFFHGWWLAINRSSALTECPQVWKRGPVFPSLYHTLKEFGRSPINDLVQSLPNFDPMIIGPDDNYAPGYVQFVWARYGHLSSFALSDLTHKQGTAWQKLAQQHEFFVPRGLAISDQNVRDEFLPLLRLEEAAYGTRAETKSG